MTTTYSNFSRQEQENMLNAYKALLSTEDRKKVQKSNKGKTSNLDRTILKKKTFLKKRGFSAHNPEQLAAEIATLQAEYDLASASIDNPDDINDPCAEPPIATTRQPAPKQKAEYYRPRPTRGNIPSF